MAVLGLLTDFVSVLALGSLIWAHVSFALRRARRAREAAAALEAAKAPLRPGFGWVHGVAKKVRGAESPVLVAGRNVTVRVQSGRSQFWQREEATRDVGPFYVVTADGQKVRVRLKDDGSDRIEVAAHEHNTHERRLVDYELCDGDEVWVEGTIEEKRTPSPGKGYREPATRSRWKLHAGDHRVTVRTRGVVNAHRATALLPRGLTALWLGVAATLAVLRLLPEDPTSVSIRLPLAVVLATMAGVVAAQGEDLWIGARPWFDRER